MSWAAQIGSATDRKCWLNFMSVPRDWGFTLTEAGTTTQVGQPVLYFMHVAQNCSGVRAALDRRGGDRFGRLAAQVACPSFARVPRRRSLRPPAGDVDRAVRDEGPERGGLRDRPQGASGDHAN